MDEPDQRGLEGLIVWKRAQDFAIEICRNVLGVLPEHEKYALISQLRRSVQSIPANIAEGYGRYYYQEGIRFTYIARGSLEETYNHLSFAHRMGYIPDELFEEQTTRIGELRKITNGFIKYLKTSKRGISEPGFEYFTNKQEPPVTSKQSDDVISLEGSLEIFKSD